MDVIGNNIANVNTTAYKSQATGFQDILYQTVKQGSGAGENVAATNTSQVGLGTKVGSIYTNITAQGSAITTNNALDLMITGAAFFRITPDRTGLERNFTRDGSFTIDANGDLVTQNNGYYVIGKMVNSDQPSSLKVINRNRDMNGDGILETDYMNGEATTEAYLKGNIDREDEALEEGRNLLLEVYGNDGEKYTIKFKLTDNADTDDSTYRVSIDKLMDKDGNTVSGTGYPELTLNFDKHNGKLTGIRPLGKYESKETAVTAEDGTVTATNISLSGDAGTIYKTYTVTGKDGKRYYLDYAMNSSLSEEADYTLALQRIRDSSGTVIRDYSSDDAEKKAAELDFSEETGSLLTINGEKTTSYSFTFDEDIPIGPVTFDLAEMKKLVYDGNNFLYNLEGDASVVGPLNVDFSNITNYAGKFGNHASNLNAYQGDTQGLHKGFGGGVLNGISFTDNGSIYGTYSNGQTVKKGQILVAEFSNAMGLEKVGDNLYKETPNSGVGSFIDVTTTGGYISSGVLEGSNVDLAREFTDMITTQRGFQANSRVITTSDEMLQILKGLKR